MHEEIGVVEEAAERKEVEPEAAGEDEVEKFRVILGAEFGVVRHVALGVVFGLGVLPGGTCWLRGNWPRG